MTWGRSDLVGMVLTVGDGEDGSDDERTGWGD